MKALSFTRVTARKHQKPMNLLLYDIFINPSTGGRQVDLLMFFSSAGLISAGAPNQAGKWYRVQEDPFSPRFWSNGRKR